MVIDDLFLRKLPPHAGDELADVIMSRYEKSSTLITSNREIDDWAKLLGDVGYRHATSRSSHAPRSPTQVRRQELAAQGIRRTSCQGRVKPRNHRSSRHRQVGEFDPATGGGS